MKRMRKRKIDTSNLVANILMVLASVTFLIPLAMVIVASVTDTDAYLKNGFSFIPEKVDFSGYALLFENPDVILKAAGLTIIIAIIAPLLKCIVCLMAGYAFANEKWVFGKFFGNFLIVNMIFSGGMIATYVVYTRYYGLGNNILVYFLPTIVEVWTIILFKTFFKGVPVSLIEAARIDGASEMQVLWKIMLPMVKSVFAMQYVLGMINKWNDFQTSLLYVTDRNMQTIQHALQRVIQNAELLLQAYSTYAISGQTIPLDAMRYAMCIMSAVPILILFPFASKNFTKGIAVGSVKG